MKNMVLMAVMVMMCSCSHIGDQLSNDNGVDEFIAIETANVPGVAESADRASGLDAPPAKRRVEIDYPECDQHLVLRTQYGAVSFNPTNFMAARTVTVCTTNVTQWANYRAQLQADGTVKYFGHGEPIAEERITTTNLLIGMQMAWDDEVKVVFKVQRIGPAITNQWRISGAQTPAQK